MSHRRLGTSGARVLALLFFFLSLSGCSSWRPIAKPPEVALAEPEPPKRLIVHLRDGTALKLESPRVHADSLFGRRISEPTSPSIRLSRAPVGEDVAIPLTDIRSIDGRHFNPLKTALLVVGVGAVWITLVLSSIVIFY